MTLRNEVFAENPPLWARRGRQTPVALIDHDPGVVASLETMLQPRAAARLLEMVLRKPLLKRYGFGFYTWRRAAVRSVDQAKATVLSPCYLLMEVLGHFFRCRQLQAFQKWQTTSVWLTSWHLNQKDFRAELESLADEDAAVSAQLMAFAETAGVRARTSGFLAAAAVLSRLQGLRTANSFQRWKALCLAQRPAFGKSHNLHQWTFRSLQHLVRARMLWAWGRWQGAKSRPSWQLEASSMVAKEPQESFLASRSLLLASRAESLLRLKVRLAWHADFPYRCSGINNEVQTTLDEDGVGTLKWRLDRGAACLLEYVLAAAHRAKLRLAFNNLLASAMERMPIARSSRDSRTSPFLVAKTCCK